MREILTKAEEVENFLKRIDFSNIIFSKIFKTKYPEGIIVSFIEDDFFRKKLIFTLDTEKKLKSAGYSDLYGIHTAHIGKNKELDTFLIKTWESFKEHYKLKIRLLFV